MSFRDTLINLLEKAGVKQANSLLEVPPDPKLGDYALPCFSLGKNPVKAAQELANKIKDPLIDHVETKGPYLNIFLNSGARAKEVLKTKHVPKKTKETIMIEYSQPNTHKAFHVGHLRGTSIGESIARILKHEGNKVVQANYSGDTGAHIAKWLWYYTTKDKSDPPKDKHDLEKWIANIYVKSIQTLTDNPEQETKVNALLRKLESKEDKQLTKTYEKTRQFSIDAFNEIYKDLHAHFDEWYFEGAVEQDGKAIVERLVKDNIAIVDDGATIVKLEEENLGVWVLLRKDGTTLYSAKDLALAEKKFKDHKITTSLYVIGHAQSMYMQQLFATLKRMKAPYADKCKHLSFAEVRLPEGKMSSRTGRNLLYSDMRKEVAAYATEEIRKRHEDWDDKKITSIVDQVVIAALKWDMLAIHPNKTITFDPKQATQFEGETGPYVQYTHARACSILRKTTVKKGDGSTLTHEKEQALVRAIEAFPETIEKVARNLEPSHLAHYTMHMAKTFNSFYHDCPVIGAPEEPDRIALVEASIHVLKTSLDLLAIDAPEEM